MVPFPQYLTKLKCSLKQSISSKGVGSIPSPVQNLVAMKEGSITHDSFTDAIMKAFCIEYKLPSGAGLLPIYVPPLAIDLGTNHDAVVSAKDFINKSETELQTWEWTYGQTPEFTHTLEGAFNFGAVVCFQLLYTNVHNTSVSIESSGSFQTWGYPIVRSY